MLNQTTKTINGKKFSIYTQISGDLTSGYSTNKCYVANIYINNTLITSTPNMSYCSTEYQAIKLALNELKKNYLV